MPDGLVGLVAKAALGVALLALVLVVIHRLFFSFMSQAPGDYADTGPVFDLRETLNGPLIANGVIYGPTGRVAARFVADMEGRWDAEGGTLAESFRYDSGRTQDRAWRIAIGSDGRFTATADDVVGPGEGIISGATATLRYRLRLPAEAGGWELDVTDWLYRVEDGTVVNRAQFRRFGVLLGELVATIRPVRQ